MHVPDINDPGAAFEANLLAHDEALETGRSPAATPVTLADSVRLDRARSCLERLERDRRETVTDTALELVRLLHAEGLLDQPSPRDTPFGRFRLVRELGRGGCGIVFLAWDPILRRHLALKIPRLDVLVRSEARQRFIREGQAAAGLAHPNIIQVLEAGEVGAICYIASAYCEGPTLAAWLKEQDQPVPVEAAANLIATVAEAIGHAHERGVIHRDLKPSNILLDPDANYARRSHAGNGSPDRPKPLAAYLPKVADFGLAKRVVGAASSSDQSATRVLPSEPLTRSGHVLGTPGYMAPEQATGAADDAGPATDVYSLGVVLYEVLTGQQPFRGATEVETLQQIIASDPVSPRRLRGGISRDLETICLKCLHRAPERRYPSMTALAEDLRRTLRGEPIQARPASALERTALWARRRPVAAALAAAGVVALLGAVAGAMWHYGELEGKNIDLQAAVQKADKERSRAETGEALARSHAYAAQIALADQFRDTGRIGLLRQALNRLRPGPDESDLRGFEWHYLWQVGGRETFLWRAGRNIDAVAFLDDGRCGAIDWDGALVIWDIQKASAVNQWDGNPSGTGAQVFSADGARFVSVVNRGNVRHVRLGDLRDLQVIAAKTWPMEKIAAAIVAPDGRSVAIRAPWEGPHIGEVIQWDVESNAERVLWNTPRTAVTQFAFSPDARMLAIAYHQSADPARPTLGIEVVDVASGRVTSTLGGCPGQIRALAFSPDGSFLAAGCSLRFVKVWDIAGGRELVTLSDQKEPVSCLAFSADGKLLAAGSVPEKGPQVNCAVCVWDWEQGRLHGPPLHAGSAVSTLVFSRTGRTLLLGDHDRRTCLYDLQAPQTPEVLPGHGPAEAWAVAFSPDGTTLLSGGDDHDLKRWDARTGALSATLKGHDSLVTAVAISRDGKRWASSSYDNTVKIWDPASGACLKTLEHSDRQWSVVFSPDQRTLAAVGVEGAITWWNLASDEVIRVLPKQPTRVRCAFAPDGKTLASCNGDGVVKIWDAATGACRATYRETGLCGCLEFSPDGKLLAVGVAEAITLRRTDTEALAGVLHGHAQRVQTLTFSPDGKTLASGGLDRSVRLWQVATGQELVCLKDLPHQVNAVAFDRDGSALAVALHDGTLRLLRAAR